MEGTTPAKYHFIPPWILLNTPMNLTLTMDEQRIMLQKLCIDCRLHVNWLQTALLKHST